MLLIIHQRPREQPEVRCPLTSWGRNPPCQNLVLWLLAAEMWDFNSFSHSIYCALLQRPKKPMKGEMVPWRRILKSSRVVDSPIQGKEGDNFAPIVCGHRNLEHNFAFTHGICQSHFFICNRRCCTRFWQMSDRKSLKKDSTDVSWGVDQHSSARALQKAYFRL